MKSMLGKATIFTQLILFVFLCSTPIALSKPSSKNAKHNTRGKINKKSSKSLKTLVSNTATSVCKCKSKSCANKKILAAARAFSKRKRSPSKVQSKAIASDLKKIKKCGKRLGVTFCGDMKVDVQKSRGPGLGMLEYVLGCPCGLKRCKARPCTCPHGYEQAAGDAMCRRKNRRYPYWTGDCRCPDQPGLCQLVCSASPQADVGDIPEKVIGRPRNP